MKSSVISIFPLNGRQINAYTHWKHGVVALNSLQFQVPTVLYYLKMIPLKWKRSEMPPLLSIPGAGTARFLMAISKPHFCDCLHFPDSHCQNMKAISWIQEQTFPHMNTESPRDTTKIYLSVIIDHNFSVKGNKNLYNKTWISHSGFWYKG